MVPSDRDTARTDNNKEGEDGSFILVLDCWRVGRNETVQAVADNLKFEWRAKVCVD